MVLNTFFFSKSLLFFHTKYTCVTFLSKGLLKKKNKKWIKIDLFSQTGSLLLKAHKKTKRLLRQLRWITVHASMFCCKSNGFRFSIIFKRNGLLLYKNFLSEHLQALASIDLNLQVGVLLFRARGGIFFLFLNTICFLNFKLYKKLLYSAAIRWKSLRSFFFSKKVKLVCTRAAMRQVYKFIRPRRSVLAAKRRKKLKFNTLKVRRLVVNKKLKRVTFYYKLVASSFRSNCRFLKSVPLK